MKLAGFLFQATGRVALSGWALSMLASAFNGGLVAMVHSALTEPQAADQTQLLAIAGLLAGKLVTGYLAGLTLHRHTVDAIHGLRNQTVQRLLQVPYARVQAVGSARIMTVLTEDLPRLQGAVQGLVGIATSGAVLLGGGCYLVYLSPQWFGIACLLALVGATLHSRLHARARAEFERARALNDGLFDRYRDLTGGMRELQLHAPRRAAFATDGVGRVTDGLRTARLRGHARQLQSQVVTQALLFGGVAGALAIAATTGEGESARTVASGYVLTVLYLAGPLMGVIRSVPLFSMAEIALQRVQGLVGALGTPTPDHTGGELPAGSPSHLPFHGLVLDAVTYRFADFVLGPIDLRLAPGQVTFITGENGSGKSTLALLLSGLYAPETGSVTLNGQPITDENRGQCRQLVSSVFFDYHLFDRVWHNPPGQRASLAHWLRRVQLDGVPAIAPLVQAGQGNGQAPSPSHQAPPPCPSPCHQALPGAALSHGQQRRLALALALAEERPILLCDEFGADQSAGFKQWFYRELLPELRDAGRTVVVVTHDDRYFDAADQQLALSAGRSTP